MQEIELPDGSIAEFPDHFSDDEIESVLQKEVESPGRKLIESKQSAWDSIARPFKAQTFKTAEALNRGIGSFSQNLHELSEYVGTKTGMQPGGAFEKGAQTYLENAEYWRKKAEETNPEFVDEMIGEAIGGAVPGIAEFMLNVPYAAITAAKDAAKRRDSETFGAITGGAKRYVLGRIFHALGVLPKPVAAPAMGGVFATEAAASGGTPEEVAKSFGTGLLYGLTQKGRPRVRKAPKIVAERPKPKIEELERYEKELREEAERIRPEEKIIDLTERIEKAKEVAEPPKAELEAKLAAEFKIPEKVWAKGTPEAKAQDFARQLNKDMPEHALKFDAPVEMVEGGPKFYQFTPQEGKWEGVTFNVAEKDLTSEGIKAKFAEKQKLFPEGFKKPTLPKPPEVGKPGKRSIPFTFEEITEVAQMLAEQHPEGRVLSTNRHWRIASEKFPKGSEQAQRWLDTKLAKVKPKAAPKVGKVAKEPYLMSKEEFEKDVALRGTSPLGRTIPQTAEGGQVVVGKDVGKGFYKSDAARYSAGPGGKLHYFKREGIVETQPGVFHVRKEAKPIATLRGDTVDLSPHEAIVQKAISEGKITSHPDYPELAKAVPKLVKKPTVKPKKVPRPGAVKSLVTDIVDAGGLWDKTLFGELRELLKGQYSKLGAVKFKKVPAIANKATGRAFDEMAYQMREQGYLFDKTNTAEFIELIEKDIKAIAEGKPENRVTIRDFDDIALQDAKFNEGIIENAKQELRQKGLSDTEVERTIKESRDIADAIPEDQVQKNYEEVSDFFKKQATLIEKEAPFELKGEEPPPKLVGPLGKKAIIPTEKIPTATKGEQVSLIKKKGEQVTIGEKIEEVVKVAKEPWEMGRAEYVQQRVDEVGEAAPGVMLPAYDTHTRMVKQAIKEGKITSHPDYPELGKVAKEPTPKKPEVVVEVVKKAGLRFTSEDTGFHQGQRDFRLIARDKDGVYLGRVDATEFQNKISVRMLEVEPEFRRQKVGTKLLKQLEKEYPEHKIWRGIQTEEGAALIAKMEGKRAAQKSIKGVRKILKTPTRTLETFPGFQKMYDAVTKGREEKVRKAVEDIRKGYLTPIEGNPLDKGAVEFLKSEKYKDYIKEMPGIGELSPKEIFKYDPEAKKLIATIETKGGELKPAIRQSGYHALKEFADSFEGAKDISKLSPSWTDPTRMIQEIDQGKWGGMAQKHIGWPMRMTTLAKLRWQDLRKAELDTIGEKYNVKSGKKARAIGDVIEYIGTKAVEADVPIENLLAKPKIQGFLKGFNPKVKTQILGAAKELRVFLDKLLAAQNIPRKIRKQKEIPKRAFYRTWIMETNLWSKLLGQKIRPEEIMEKPTMPDFIFPNQPFNPRAEARTGLMAKYPKERNIIRLMTDYIDTAGKDIFDTNIVHNNKIHAAVLRSKGLENAAEGINRVTAEVFAGVDPRLTRWAKETVPPKARKGILAIRRNLTRAVFPLNWTWNMFIQTSSAGITLARYGVKANVAGLRYFSNPTIRRSVKRNAYSYILKSRWGGKAHYQDVQKSISRNKRLEAKPIEKVEDFLNYMTSAFEDGLTGHAVAAAYHQGKTKFKLKGRELWEYASEGGAKTQSMYNYGDVPGMLRAREVGAIAPFQTFGFEVFNTVREMNIPGLRRVIGKTGLYETLSANSVTGKALMSNRLKMLARWVVAIAITDAVGEAAIGRKPWVVSSFIPFIGYILGGYAGRGPVPHQYIQDAKQGIKDVLVYGDFKRLRKWVMRYHVLAGVQLERMIEGIEAVSKGRVTDIRGRTLFEVEPEDYLKAITMGPYRTEPGKEYIRKRRESKSLLERLKKKKAKKWRIVPKKD